MLVVLRSFEHRGHLSDLVSDRAGLDRMYLSMSFFLSWGEIEAIEELGGAELRASHIDISMPGSTCPLLKDISI